VGAAEVNFRETKHSGGLAMLRLYHEAERPVVVHYWYKSCAMCKVMKPVIQRVVNEYAEEIYYVDVEISANKKTMKYAGIRSIPAIQVYERGKVRPRWPFPRAGKVTAAGLGGRNRYLCMRVSLSLSLSLSLALCMHA
jgi:thiol:disulfide interchange protein